MYRQAKRKLPRPLFFCFPYFVQPIICRWNLSISARKKKKKKSGLSTFDEYCTRASRAKYGFRRMKLEIALCERACHFYALSFTRKGKRPQNTEMLTVSRSSTTGGANFRRFRSFDSFSISRLLPRSSSICKNSQNLFECGGSLATAMCGESPQ